MLLWRPHHSSLGGFQVTFLAVHFMVPCLDMRSLARAKSEMPTAGVFPMNSPWIWRRRRGQGGPTFLWNLCLGLVPRMMAPRRGMRWRPGGKLGGRLGVTGAHRAWSTSIPGGNIQQAQE